MVLVTLMWGKLKTSSPFSCAALSMTLHKVKINPPNPKSGWLLIFPYNITSNHTLGSRYGAPNQSIFPLHLYDPVYFLYGQFDFLYGQLFTFYMINSTFYMVSVKMKTADRG